MFLKKVKIPFENNDNKKQLARFFYQPNLTEVRDFENNLTKYHHDQKKLHKIEYFNNQEQLHSIVKFLWEGNFLSCKVKCDQDDNFKFIPSLATKIISYLERKIKTYPSNLESLKLTEFAHIFKRLNNFASYQKSEYVMHNLKKMIKDLESLSIIKYSEDKSNNI